MIFWLFKRCKDISAVLLEDTGTGSDKAGKSEDDAKDLECDSGGMQSEPKSGLKFNIFEDITIFLTSIFFLNLNWRFSTAQKLKSSLLIELRKFKNVLHLFIPLKVLYKRNGREYQKYSR